MYICTVGIAVSTFELDAPDERCLWSAFNWFDFAVDIFFVIDVMCRCFFFGIIVDSPLVGGEQNIILEPDLVMSHYISTVSSPMLSTSVICSQEPTMLLSLNACYECLAIPSALCRDRSSRPRGH